MIEPEQINILIVDDIPANLLALESLLESQELKVFKAQSGNEALGLLLEHDFGLVLLDVQMPDMDGFETAELMRSNEKTRNIPIIFVTAISKEKQHIFKGYESGAVDYLFKPLDPHVLRSKVRVFLDIHLQKLCIEKANRQLEITVEKLNLANLKIQQQQQSIIEEERLNLLLQLAGATASELNQPLIDLLETIDLLKLEKNDHSPGKLKSSIKQIETSGRRIYDIVRRIQTIPHLEAQPGQMTSEPYNVTHPSVRLLAVEASDKDFLDIKTLVVSNPNASIRRSESINEALNLLQSNNFDLVLAGYFLPDGTGLELIKKMGTAGIETPVIIITGKGDEIIATKVIQAGAYDYLPKDQLHGKSLMKAIINSLNKLRIKKEIKAAMEKMADLSIRDVLTGLYNRRYFFEALEREISRANRTGTGLVLCMMDIDHFKKVNDTMGHLAGDMVLSEFGKMLKDWIRHSDLPCRYGGEEFAVILSDTDVEKASGVCERFRNTLDQRIFVYNQTSFKITTSIGISSLALLATKTGENLVRTADEALYQAKNEGRNRVVIQSRPTDFLRVHQE